MTDNLDRARVLSAKMRQAVIVLASMVAMVTLWFIFKAATDGPWLAQTLFARFGNFAPFTISPLQAGLFIVVAILQSAAVLAGLLMLANAFGQISATGGVDYNTAIGVRRAGIAFGIAAIILILSIPLDTLIASIGQPEGRRFLSVGLETQHLLALLLSAVLITLGHVLALAADIAEDNRQIV
jgi:hypothetical protein